MATFEIGDIVRLKWNETSFYLEKTKLYIILDVDYAMVVPDGEGSVLLLGELPCLTPIYRHAGSTDLAMFLSERFMKVTDDQSLV